MIKYVIENKLMPPWNISKHTGPWKNSLGLSSQQEQMILKWIDEGLPYKIKNIKLSHQKKIKKINQPDYVIKLNRPVEIPATGVIPYERLISIPNFSEDKYLKEIEYIVKSKVIHHIQILTLNKSLLPEIIKKPSDFWHEEKRMIDGWSIGSESVKKQDQNVGIKISKDSFFIVRIHYETVGQKLIDIETSIKLKFYSKIPKYSLFKDKVSDKNLNIMPYQDNYKSEVYYKLKKNMFLTGVFPHMHLRGKSSTISIQDPEGNETEIFSQNPFIFNFQKAFYLEKPLQIQKDHTLVCRNYFDNSSKNPANPDPSTLVKTGLYTENEMSECYFGFLIPNF